MKNKKPLIYGLSAVAVIALIFLVRYTVAGNNELSEDNPEFSQYVTGYTSGVISRGATIKLRLSTSIIEEIKEKQKLPEKLFKLKPGVDGKYSWIDDNTLEFKPDELLDSDREYLVTFNLDDLVNMPDGFEEFVFKVQTVKQSFDVVVEEVVTTDMEKLKWQKIKGVVKTADIADEKLLNKLLSAKQDGDKLEISWLEGSADKEYKFEINKVARKNEASDVEIEWDGDALDVDKEGSMNISIPSIDNFAIMQMKVVQYPSQYLQIQFSDPLKQNQQLRGLISIGTKKNLRYVIDNNSVKVYPNSRLKGDFDVTVREGIQNILGFKFKGNTSNEVSFEEIKPAIRLVNNGVILPTSEKGLIFPFEAVNLKAVDVKIVKIYENNIVQFLQVNDMDGEYQLNRVGEVILTKTIALDQSELTDFGKWNRFHLDLSELIQTEPGAIYRITLNFRQKHSLFECQAQEKDDSETNVDSELDNWNEQAEDDSYWDSFDDWYYGDYDWENRENPCSSAFYGGRRAVSQNLLASDIGLIVKRGNDGSLTVATTNLLDTKPMNGVDIEVRNYQNRVLATEKTNSDGMVQFVPTKDPYFIVAKKDEQRGYVKIGDGESLSMSYFDVSGKNIQKGLKGFIYGERGVWRPGDTLHLAFVLKEESDPLPEGHPIVFEFRNPRNQLVKRVVKHKNTLGFYAFPVSTNQDDPTGLWEAKVTVGGVDFYESLKIETVKPNRLKINIEFDKEFLMAGDESRANMEVKWLHGAVAANLKADVDVKFSSIPTSFKKYTDFSFDDQTKRYYPETNNLYSGQLNENGKTNFNTLLRTAEGAPGFMRATFVTRVYEEGGDFSIDQFSMPYYPYKSFVGVRLPKGDKARGMLLTDTSHTVEVVILDKDGKLVKDGHALKAEFYKINWRWWWDKSTEDLSNFSYRSSVEKLSSENMTSKNGKASWKIRVQYPDWGRYMVRISDLTSGHSTSKVVYIDWPGWAGRAQKDGLGNASMLSFTSDKQVYNVGEQVKLTIPSSEEGRALVSIENGSKVVETHWIETNQGETNYKFNVTEDMTPNVYVNITMLQAHNQEDNDLPIRLYGVIPISVEDPETRLEPILTMPDVLNSEEEFTVQVSEKDNKEMIYTIAVVDEGLLDLTRFKTPNPWDVFYAKEALGVKTWDMYDWVIGAYGEKLERLLAIGGDDEVEESKNQKANRFKPVVQYLGPFHLKKGKRTHKIKMPQYIGSVRTMVVAGNGKAYGAAEKATAVVKPLMMLATVPRVLSPQEKLSLPVNLFSMNENIKNVEVKIVTDDLIKVNGKNTKSVSFSKTGEKNLDFDIEVAEKIGITKIKFIAKSGKFTAEYDVELDVRNPNPYTTDVTSKVLKVGEKWDANFEAFGLEGSNSARLEISTMPPIDLDKRLKYLIQYPHGCVEQTTSGVFPQLFLADVVQLDKNQKEDIAKNVKAGITRLMKFQLDNGGLGYWPNSTNVSEWGTNYAGHFLVMADKNGYAVSSQFLKNWRKYQKLKARNWNNDGPSSQLIQTYRLYVLALAGDPEKGAMNRMKEISNLAPLAKMRLAATYALTGKEKIAKELMTNLAIPEKFENPMSLTFGSAVRDKAMMLETFTILKDDENAFMMLKDLSEALSKNQWYSTQETAYSLIAIAQYAKDKFKDSDIDIQYNLNSKSENIKASNIVAQADLSISQSGKNTISVTNKGKSMAYVSIIQTGLPRAGDETSGENNLQISTQYYDLDGENISVDNIAQGTDFIAEVKVKHPGTKDTYTNMALTQIFPSGWEIMNPRMVETAKIGSPNPADYEDYKDDRVYSYFTLTKGREKTFRYMLHASYTGKFYLPTVSCEAMYDATIYARKKGNWIEVK